MLILDILITNLYLILSFLNSPFYGKNDGKLHAFFALGGLLSLNVFCLSSLFFYVIDYNTVPDFLFYLMIVLVYILLYLIYYRNKRINKLFKSNKFNNKLFYILFTILYIFLSAYFLIWTGDYLKENLK